jgi:hypothetical protein
MLFLFFSYSAKRVSANSGFMDHFFATSRIDDEKLFFATSEITDEEGS